MNSQAPEKSDSLERLVHILSDRGPMRAGQLGQELWWKPGDVIRPENDKLTGQQKLEIEGRAL